MNSMLWRVEFSEKADKQLLALDKPIRERIRNFVKNLQELPNPRMRGEPLTGNLSDFWKYRIGDYRLICRIGDNGFVVLVIKIGHRSEVYKKR